MAPAQQALPPPRRLRAGRLRPRGLVRFLLVRTVLAIGTLVAISIIVFAATQLLPGNAAKAKLGKQATPASVKALRRRTGARTNRPSTST